MLVHVEKEKAPHIIMACHVMLNFFFNSMASLNLLFMILESVVT
jgi:hypothetical protein